MSATMSSNAEATPGPSVPRKRGRPRKSETLAKEAASIPITTPVPSSPLPGGPTDAVRRGGRTTRGKPPKKFEPDLSPVRKRATNFDGRRAQRVISDSSAVDGKTAQPVPDVCINLSVNRKEMVPYLKDVGMYILYFCKKCVFRSKKLSDITEHLALNEHCENKVVASEGKEETVSNAPDGSAGHSEVPGHLQALDDMANADFSQPDSLNDETSQVIRISVPAAALEEELPVEEEKLPKEEEDDDMDEDYVEEKEVPDESGEEEMEEDDSGEHNYADDVLADDDEKALGYDGEKLSRDEVLEEEELEGEVPDNYRWRCEECPYTRLYSPQEQEIHRQCHGTNGKGIPHCYICKAAGKSRCLRGLEWHRIKAHLVTGHEVDFEIQCSKCDEMFHSHRQFMKHYRSHRMQCTLCRYDSADNQDIDIHTKCHDPDDNTKFKCWFCSYVSLKQPGKWSLMHNHLVTHHSGCITPLFNCAVCKKGFQEIRRYRFHKRRCLLDQMVECELCHTQINKSRLVTHAMWHVRSAEEADRKKNSLNSLAATTNSLPSPTDPVPTDGIVVETETAEASAASILTSLGQNKLTNHEEAVIVEEEIVPEVAQSTEIIYAEAETSDGPTLTELTAVEIDTTGQAVIVDASGNAMGTLQGDISASEMEFIVQTGIAEDGSVIIENLQQTIAPSVASREPVLGVPTEIVSGGQEEEKMEIEQIDDKAVVIEPVEDEVGVEGKLHPGEDITQNEFYCIEHEAVFSSQVALTKHYVEVHWGISEDRLKSAEPERKRGRGRPPGSKNKTYKIPKPDPDFDPNAPKASYKERNPEKCELCLRRFPSLEHLVKHKRKAHPGNQLKRVLCQICGKDFRNRAQFRNHYRTVHEGKKRKPPSKPYIERKKMFICELCGYTTPETMRLRNHKLSVHEGVMPYACDVCDYRTNEKSDLRRHMHRHEGIKRYACEFCQYRTDQRWLLVNHCLRQHGIQLPKISRNTRGGIFSNRRRKREAEEHTMQLQQVITQTEAGEEVTVLISDDMIGDQTISVKEEEIAVEALQQEGHVEEVVYVREDGTILEPEEAALMLLGVPGVPADGGYFLTEG